MSANTKLEHVLNRAADSLRAAQETAASLGASDDYTDEEIESGAIALAFCNRSPKARRLSRTPEGYFSDFPPDAQESYRIRVRVVLAAVDAAWVRDPDDAAGLM